MSRSRPILSSQEGRAGRPRTSRAQTMRRTALAWATVLLTAPSLFAQGPGTEDNPLYPWHLPRIAYRGETSNAVGREGGLSSVQFTLPLNGDQDRDAVFFRDFRFLGYHDTKTFTVNVGAGYRCFLPHIEGALGGYGYYDCTSAPGRVIHQATFGLDYLGDL